MSFADHVRAALPEALHLPDAFAVVFDWAEGHGHLGAFPKGQPYVSLYPTALMNEPGASYLIFHPDGPPLATPIPEDIVQRYATIATAAGDGGTMGFWLDDTGKQQVVIFDHGWPYVLTDDPLKALLFLAIGYSEPAALTNASFTAQEAADDWGADTPLLPEAFRQFLQTQFGVTIPDRASDLGLAVPKYEDMTDPMRQWIRKLMPN